MGSGIKIGATAALLIAVISFGAGCKKSDSPSALTEAEVIAAIQEAWGIQPVHVAQVSTYSEIEGCDFGKGSPVRVGESYDATMELQPLRYLSDKILGNMRWVESRNLGSLEITPTDMADEPAMIRIRGSAGRASYGADGYLLRDGMSLRGTGFWMRDGCRIDETWVGQARIRVNF